jgi:uncharacterized Tic20 family protein
MNDLPGTDPEWNMIHVADPSHSSDPTRSDGPLVDGQAQEWERTYAMFNHLSLLTFHVMLPVIPALVLWLVKRDRSPFVDDHGREAVNFQLSLVLYALVVVPVTGLLTCGVGALLWIAVYALGVVGMILASVAANRGEYYRYPACVRFIR